MRLCVRRRTAPRRDATRRDATTAAATRRLRLRAPRPLRCVDPWPLRVAALAALAAAARGLSLPAPPL